MRDRQPQVGDASFEVVEEAGSGAWQLAFIAFDEFVFDEPGNHGLAA
jgi:hypothetical protein